MVSTGLALAACIVPPACVFVVVVWTTIIYWRLKRLARPHKSTAAPPAPLASPLETVELHPALVLPQPRFPPDTHPPFCTTSTAAILRTDLFASLPSPRPPPPPEPRFSIRTTFARDGSRVLARPAPSVAGQGEGRQTGDGNGEASARPARTRRDRGQSGIGSGDDDERWELVQGGHRAPLDGDDDRAGPVVNVDGEATVTPRRRAGLTRRSSTWSARDLEGVFLGPSATSRSPTSHLNLPHAHAASLSPSRGGPRPLPPGARHESSTRTSGDERGTSETSGEAGLTPMSSQESGGPLLGRQGGSDRRHEWAERNWGGQVEYVSTHAPTSSTRGNGVEALPTTAHAHSPSDSILSLNSFFFGTTSAPLPPGSASGSSAGHGQRRQSTWSTSTYEAVFTDLPTRSRPVRASIAFQSRHAPPAPPPIDVRSLPERHISHAVALTDAPPALTHAATSPAAFEPYSKRPVGAPTRSSTLPPRSTDPHEHPSSPGNAPPSSHHPSPPLPPPSHDWLPSAHLSRLDARRERSAILAARRPVSWLGRQGSNGSLPESVPAFGNLEIVNPDIDALNAPAAPGSAR
ncbi:hypothetical protein JCM3775_000766 [Rhodotorula graminis]